MKQESKNNKSASLNSSIADQLYETSDDNESTKRSMPATDAPSGQGIKRKSGQRTKSSPKKRRSRLSQNGTSRVAIPDGVAAIHNGQLSPPLTRSRRLTSTGLSCWARTRSTTKPDLFHLSQIFSTALTANLLLIISKLLFD